MIRLSFRLFCVLHETQFSLVLAFLSESLYALKAVLNLCNVSAPVSSKLDGLTLGDKALIKSKINMLKTVRNKT